MCAAAVPAQPCTAAPEAWLLLQEEPKVGEEVPPPTAPCPTLASRPPVPHSCALVCLQVRFHLLNWRFFVHSDKQAGWLPREKVCEGCAAVVRP